MNYRLFTDSQSPRLLSEFEKPIEFKPHVGDIITIGLTHVRWVITREQTNTGLVSDERITEGGLVRITEDGLIRITDTGLTPDSDVSFDFFARIQNTSPDSISMKKDFAKLQQNLNRFG